MWLRREELQSGRFVLHQLAFHKEHSHRLESVRAALTPLKLGVRKRSRDILQHGAVRLDRGRRQQAEQLLCERGGEVRHEARKAPPAERIGGGATRRHDRRRRPSTTQVALSGILLSVGFAQRCVRLATA